MRSQKVSFQKNRGLKGGPYYESRHCTSLVRNIIRLIIIAYSLLFRCFALSLISWDVLFRLNPPIIPRLECVYLPCVPAYGRMPSHINSPCLAQVKWFSLSIVLARRGMLFQPTLKRILEGAQLPHQRLSFARSSQDSIRGSRSSLSCPRTFILKVMERKWWDTRSQSIEI
jgi:hypothetical protein